MPADVKIKAAISRSARRPSFTAAACCETVRRFSMALRHHSTTPWRTSDSVRALASYPPPLQTRFRTLRDLTLEYKPLIKIVPVICSLKKTSQSYIHWPSGIDLAKDSRVRICHKKKNEETRTSLQRINQNDRFIRFGTCGPALMDCTLKKLRTPNGILMRLQ